MQEAPFSANMTVETPKGFQVQFTIRSQDEQELFRRLTVMLKWFEEKAFVPRTRRAETPTLASGTAGEQSIAPQGHAVCPNHGAAKTKESSKAKGTYYCSAKMADGTYCPWRA